MCKTNSWNFFIYLFILRCPLQIFNTLINTPGPLITWIYTLQISQAIEKNAKKTGFLKKGELKKKEAPKKHKAIKKLIALSLLKATDIPKAYETIKLDMVNTFGKNCANFLKYFEGQWMKDPSAFSVYRCKFRTNNVLESYHRNLNAVLKKNPQPSKFFGKSNS